MPAGKFYLAYVNEGTAFNPAVHNVEDEQIFQFQLEQAEGEFAGLELQIKNPKIGVLNATRKLWAWFSYDTGTSIVALFYGRIVGVPQDMQNEVVTVSFVAKPVDYQEQKTALATTMRAAGEPYWDGVWFDPDKRDDPDNVLESRPELWHINRVSHVVTTSNVINGEDGTLSFTDDEVFYENMSVSYGEVPLKSAKVIATVNWDMDATDVFDISHIFRDHDLLYIRSFTGKGLVDKWPKAGANLGNGWKVHDGLAERIDGQGENVYYVNTSTLPGISDTLDNPFTYRPPGELRVLFPHTYPDAIKTFVPAYLRNWKTFGQDEMSQILAIMCWHVKGTMTVEYEASRKYKESVTIQVDADVQDVLTDPGGADILSIELSSSEIVSPIDPGGLLPIRDVRRRSYFASDRGTQSIEYLIALLRSRLLARARCVDLSFEIPLARFIADDVSCRMNVTFDDPRLPGETVAGKIKSYRLSLDGQSGLITAELTIGCSVGKGGTVTADEGDPDYVDDDYVDPDYQYYTNNIIMPFAGEITYKSIEGDLPNDDGLDLLALHNDNVVKSFTMTHDADEQETALLTDEKGNVTGNCDTAPGDVFKRLDDHEHVLDLVMRPVTGGPFETNHVVETSVLKIPKTIDLEAASV